MYGKLLYKLIIILYYLIPAVKFFFSMNKILLFNKTVVANRIIFFANLMLHILNFKYIFHVYDIMLQALLL